MVSNNLTILSQPLAAPPAIVSAGASAGVSVYVTPRHVKLPQAVATVSFVTGWLIVSNNLTMLSQPLAAPPAIVSDGTSAGVSVYVTPRHVKLPQAVAIVSSVTEWFMVSNNLTMLSQPLLAPPAIVSAGASAGVSVYVTPRQVKLPQAVATVSLVTGWFIVNCNTTMLSQPVLAPPTIVSLGASVGIDV